MQERLERLQSIESVELAGETITTQAEITAGAATAAVEVVTGELRPAEIAAGAATEGGEVVIIPGEPMDNGGGGG